MSDKIEEPMRKKVTIFLKIESDKSRKESMPKAYPATEGSNTLGSISHVSRGNFC